MHPLALIAARRGSPHRAPSSLAGPVDDLAVEVADYVVAAAAPAIEARVQAAIPGLAEQFVDSAMPRVQEQLVNMGPQLQQLAVQSAQAVLSDEQIQATLKEATSNMEQKMFRGFIAAGVATTVAVLLGVAIITRK
jgi:hypothetical protein